MTTLRVWEARYGAFAPAKSAGQHRLYSDSDVIKARLMRQLSEAGHSVGGTAHLAVGVLQRMLGTARSVSAPSERKPVSTTVVGALVAGRLNSSEWRHRYLGELLDIRNVYADLGAVEEQADRTDILLVRVNTLHADVHRQLDLAVARLKADRAILLYNYGSPSMVEALAGAGVILRREPVSDPELAEVIRSVVMVDVAQSMSALGTRALIPRRRYSEATLAQVASSPNSVVCECPRHIAELIGQLASFEEYSERCLNDSTEDAQLHAYLRSVAGSARALFEHALQRAAAHGGVVLQEDVSVTTAH